MVKSGGEYTMGLNFNLHVICDYYSYSLSSCTGDVALLLWPQTWLLWHTYIVKILDHIISVQYLVTDAVGINIHDAGAMVVTERKQCFPCEEATQ